jgi:hypothetical protein
MYTHTFQQNENVQLQDKLYTIESPIRDPNYCRSTKVNKREYSAAAPHM